MTISSIETRRNYDLKDLSIVSDFPNVFLDEILGLPLRREIEFIIDFTLEFEPISVALCRISRLEEIIRKAFQMEVHKT